MRGNARAVTGKTDHKKCNRVSNSNSKLGVESLIRECKITTYHLLWTTLNTNIHTSNSLRVAGVHSKML